MVTERQIFTTDHSIKMVNTVNMVNMNMHSIYLVDIYLFISSEFMDLPASSFRFLTLGIFPVD